MDNVFLVAALSYALIFWAVGWRFPAVALALVFGAAPFQNDLGGGFAGVKFSFSEINLVLSLPLLAGLLLRGERQVKLWPFFWPSALYFAVCIASLFVMWRGNAALTSMLQMMLFMFVLIPVFSVLARRPEDLRLALWGLLCVAAFMALVLLIQRSQYVLGIHKNGLGGSLGCAFLVAFELWFHYRTKASWHRWAVSVLLLIIAAGLLFTLSRGAWLGTLSGVFLIVVMRRQFVLLGRMALLLLPVLAVAWQLLPAESRDYATDFDAKRGNIKARYINQDIAIGEWQKSPILGNGVGIRKQRDATQLVLFTLAESGVLGLAAFTAIFVTFFAMVWKTQQRLSRDEMAYSLLAIGGALMVARLGQGMVDHYWARGPTMMGWAAAGMATGAFLYGPKHSYSHRLQRARALLALHLIEMRRRRRHGLATPTLSSEELQRANEALSLVRSQRVLEARSEKREARI